MDMRIPPDEIVAREMAEDEIAADAKPFRDWLADQGGEDDYARIVRAALLLHQYPRNEDASAELTRATDYLLQRYIESRLDDDLHIDNARRVLREDYLRAIND